MKVYQKRQRVKWEKDQGRTSSSSGAADEAANHVEAGPPAADADPEARSAAADPEASSAGPEETVPMLSAFHQAALEAANFVHCVDESQEGAVVEGDGRQESPPDSPEETLAYPAVGACGGHGPLASAVPPTGASLSGEESQLPTLPPEDLTGESSSATLPVADRNLALRLRTSEYGEEKPGGE